MVEVTNKERLDALKQALLDIKRFYSDKFEQYEPYYEKPKEIEPYIPSLRERYSNRDNPPSFRDYINTVSADTIQQDSGEDDVFSGEVYKGLEKIELTKDINSSKDAYLFDVFYNNKKSSLAVKAYSYQYVLAELEKLNEQLVWHELQPVARLESTSYSPQTYWSGYDFYLNTTDERVQYLLRSGSSYLQSSFIQGSYLLDKFDHIRTPDELILDYLSSHEEHVNSVLDHLSYRKSETLANTIGEKLFWYLPNKKLRTRVRKNLPMIYNQKVSMIDGELKLIEDIENRVRQFEEIGYDHVVETFNQDVRLIDQFFKETLFTDSTKEDVYGEKLQKVNEILTNPGYRYRTEQFEIKART